MGYLAETASPRVRAGRVAGAAAGGALIGALNAWIFTAGVDWARSATAGCQASQGPDALCLAVPRAAANIAGNVAVIAVGTLLTLWALGVRPKRIAVPAGCAVIAVAVTVTTGELIGGATAATVTAAGPPPWATALMAGVALATVVMAADHGWVRVTGLAGAGVVVAASFLVPWAVARQERADGNLAQVASLGVPLYLPSVPGYHTISGTPDSGGAEVSMGLDGAASGDLDRAFTVQVIDKDSTYGLEQLAACETVPGQDPPRGACRAEGPGRWLIVTAYNPFHEALAVRNGLVVIAQPLGNVPPSDQVLLQAVSSLKPATAAQIAALLP
jgi:hypothetical protein